MKPRTLLVLALLVAALGAFIWFVERDLPSTDERGELAKKVLPIEGDEVTALEIRLDESVVRLERVAVEETDGGDEEEADAGFVVPPTPEWRLVEPLAARADAEAVGDLVDRLAELEKQRTLEEVSADELGLTEPRATVTVTAGGEEHVLRVGADVPASSNLIVDRGAAAGEAYVVSDLFWGDLSRPAGDWRAREVLAAERDEVTAIRLRGGASEVLLRRGDDGFSIAEPLADEADRDRVDDLLSALTGLRVETFLDEPRDPTALGLAPPAAVVEVTVGGAESVEIALGAPVEETADADAEGSGAERYVRVGDQRFIADTRLAELATREPAFWRSTAWTGLEVYEIDAVEVRRAGETVLRLERREGDWLRDGEEIAYTAASDLLYALRDAEAVRVADRAALLDEGAEPDHEIVLTTAERGDTLLLYPAVADGYPGERAGRAAVLLLAREDVDELIAKIEAAERAEPVPAPADADEQTG